MRIVTETKGGFDPSCGFFGAGRSGIEHGGKIICWSEWDDNEGEELLREIVKRYNHYEGQKEGRNG